MSLINVNVGILAYSDPNVSNQPMVRLADLKWSLQGLKTDTFRNIPISLAPGESTTIISTARSISYSGSTLFDITVNNDKMKITCDVGQRTQHAAGDDNTTVWKLARNGNAMRLTATAGTIPSFLNIVVGDTVKITFGWNAYNRGSFTVLSKGTGFVDFRNDLGLDEENILGGIAFYSSGPVQIGDVLNIANPQFAFPNQGSFPITDVTDTYIEVLNPFAFTQQVNAVTSGFDVFPFSYKWMAIAVDRRILVGLNGDNPVTIEVEPPSEGDIVKQPGLFIKRGKVFEVRLKNPGNQQAEGMLLLCQ